MPGILPMKVIKVGSSSQSRIAQACDRCRSKKIRCDGIRPCCSQCANVGFECRTSDKLSRRAFPRGYTESLEERVRILETEVRELKDLLDEKDEKIDMLSRMHENNHRHQHSNSASHSLPPTENRREPSPRPTKEDTFRLQASPLLLGVENSDSYFMGPSSGRAFVEAFKRRVQEEGKPCSDFNPEAFLHIQGCPPLTTNPPSHNMGIPARLFSDRCVNVYFQEWAPLFPVLHKPTFLRVYQDFVADPEKLKNNHKLAQLYLVFSIAGLSSEQPDLEQIAACEQQWQKSLDAVVMDNTMPTLQCLVLALMYCTIRADYKRLQHYKGVAVGLSHRLGLHQSQKRFSFGALTIETRKKVFWTLYTLDCFSAAILGLPMLFEEDDIHVEYPSDTDDEYVTEKGFQACLPGEHTRLSSALALFRASRILAKVLKNNYPAAASHELSLQQMSVLQAELDEWCQNLPSHLKLNFKQDKPSTDVTGSRSPLLALAYYYTKILIYRPAVGSSLGSKAAPALLSISESSKHIIQIVQLLEERSLSFSFCLNKPDTLILAGITLLYQSLDLKQDSKLMKDNERFINAVIKIVDRAKAPGSFDLTRIAGLLITLDEPSQATALPTPPRQSPDVSSSMAAPPQRPSPAMSSHPQHRQRTVAPSLGRQLSASMSETDLLVKQEALRRMSMPQSQHRDLSRARSRPSLNIARAEQARAGNHHRLSLGQAEAQAAQAAMIARLSPTPGSNFKHNLDFLPLGTPTSSRAQGSQPPSPLQARAQQQNSRRRQQQQQQPQQQPQQQQQQQQQQHGLYDQSQQKPSGGVSQAEWEALLGSLDSGQLYDAIYGGPGLTSAVGETTPVSANTAWSPDPWDLSGFNLGGGGDFNGGGASSAAAAQSVLSFSEESLSSGDDLAPSDMGLSVGSIDYGNPLLAGGATSAAPEAFNLEGLETNFGL